jgi:hypothetical protein
MNKLNIKEKLKNIGVNVEDIILGDFDLIGELTAKRHRAPTDENYKRFGAVFRSSYERGILMYYLIQKFNLRSMLEIGFGRGYATFCCAKAFYDMGVQGRIVTIDPVIDEKYIKSLASMFPRQVFEMIEFAKGTSEDVVPKLDERKFDLVYIDGDHSYAATKKDWELVKNKYNVFVLFDDYHLPSKNDPGIQCARAIDEIEGIEKELIILDRRIFADDRKFTDEQVNYGQVLFSNDHRVKLQGTDANYINDWLNDAKEAQK